MAIETITCTFTGETVRAPQGAGDWQLYQKPGAGLAAYNLNRALQKAANAPTDDEALDIMRKALHSARKYGAQDTEPCVVAERLLGRLRRRDFGWSL